MASEKVQKIYEKIKFLAAEIGNLDLPSKFIEVAKKGDKEKLCELFEKFKKENTELWGKMSALFEEYRFERIQIFKCNSEEKNDELFEYDSSEIEPINLCFLFMFSSGYMDEMDVFEDREILYPYLIEQGYEQFVKYMEDDYFNCIYNLLEIVILFK